MVCHASRRTEYIKTSANGYRFIESATTGIQSRDEDKDSKRKRSVPCWGTPGLGSGHGKMQRRVKGGSKRRTQKIMTLWKNKCTT